MQKYAIGSLLSLVGAAAFGVLLAGTAHAQSAAISLPANVIPPPLSTETIKYFRSHPAAWSAFVAKLPRKIAHSAPNRHRFWPGSAGTWSMATGAPSGLCSPHLLHDGTVMAQTCSGSTWYRLTPNSSGSYSNGTWSAAASLPVISATQYAPLYYASGVLADGRLMIQGGEYNNGGSTPAEESFGAIYDPVADTWTSVDPPAGVEVSDSQSVVLSDGTFMLGPCCDNPATDWLLNPSTLTWTATGAPIGGQNYQDEQGYELLPNGNVLTIDIWTNYPSGGATNTELYNPGSGLWSAGNATSASLPDPAGCGNWEIGPAVVRGNQTLVAFGGYTCSGPDPISILDLSTGNWSAGPNVPSKCGSDGTADCSLADAPAALLPNGATLFAASAGYALAPTHFFEMGLGTNKITQVADPIQDSDNSPNYVYNFLMLPSGQVLVTDSNAAEIYTPVGAPVAAWAPKVHSVPATETRGHSYWVTGNQLSGRSAGSYYGDDVQSATNFPVVRIVNNGTGHVFYANTKTFSTLSIAPNVFGKFRFVVPSGAETGPSMLYVVANGIASSGNAITVQ